MTRDYTSQTCNSVALPALQFRQAAVDLNSENPSAIKLFVLTQAALIEKGHSRKEAYQIVEDEFKKAMAG